MSDTSGTVGSTARIIISSESHDLRGEYWLWWGQWIAEPDDTNFELLKGETDKDVYEVTLDFVVPEVSYTSGNYQMLYYNQQINARGGSAATLLFKIEPDLKLNPSSVSPGATVTINGTGFTANDVCELSLDGNALNMEIESSSKGSFTVEFTVPDTIAGNHEFKATAEKLYTADATTSLKVVPTINLEPEHPDVGTEVTLTGIGFAGNSEVSIDYNKVTMGNSPTTDEVGNFSHTFVIQEDSDTEHQITATDAAGNIATIGMPLEGQAPPTPSAISPQGQRFGWFGAQTVYFTWTGVSDPSGISYTVEIAENLNFFPLAPGMRKTELTQPNCTANIEPGTYYWRVRATDGAGNEGDWVISPYPFKVGFFPVWSIALAGFILVAALIITVRMFYRRVREYYF